MGGALWCCSFRSVVDTFYLSSFFTVHPPHPQSLVKVQNCPPTPLRYVRPSHRTDNLPLSLFRRTRTKSSFWWPTHQTTTRPLWFGFGRAAENDNWPVCIWWCIKITTLHAHTYEQYTSNLTQCVPPSVRPAFRVASPNKSGNAICSHFSYSRSFFAEKRLSLAVSRFRGRDGIVLT